MIDDSPSLFSVREAAKTLGRDRSTVRRWIAAGDLRAVRMNGRNYIPRDEIERIRRGEQR